MRTLDKYQGVIPAFYACYDKEGKIDGGAVEKLANYYLEVGVKGLYVGGSSGECIYQNVEERKEVLEHVMEAVGGKMTIIAHVAAPSTDQSVELAKHAATLGVDALAAIPPLYYGLNEAAIEQYWTKIATATDLDFIIYNIPQTTGYALSLNLLEKMLKLDQVIGVKNSSMPVMDINVFRNNQVKDIIVFNGPDEQFIGGRAMGAQAGIGGTYGAMPKLFLQLNHLFEEGKLEEAYNLQNKINEIIFALQSGEGHMYAIIKGVLRLRGIDIGEVRQPFLPASASDQALIESVYQTIIELED
ncbi:dihydrodipicolinate synthase family protein [Vagococcus zengguangii]|uniref:N-acetylneuraminate lyase n=1 Tax=Vagococcus zengguangii TaxID=2571750 RepID=A0A4D7CTB4_9ENTE|nr:dihydrodipicolinate synthase family protein [Vagococcus zengguangii]QCI87238.1 N-acetylneuraminate lyase [Vagococcus zengguangii]TLG80742.1 N-acetylneuraminate lyase [Vagococcus zengguangii]